MQKFINALLLLILITSFCFAQNVQRIRGRVIDKDSKSPIPGATVVLLTDSNNLKGTASDENGYFRIEDVPAGRHTIKVFLMGFKEQVMPGLVLSSGKEMILNIELEESVMSMQEVEITARAKDETVNEMSSVSARTFNVEETERYAGSRGDPARMASNFAGVQGSNDQRNDIVVRGNSPMGVLWRVDGVDIPNPSHFAIQGTTGGPVSILNNKMFDNSDFMTGAFPAEYGNTTAGVFDLKTRNGNNEKHEFTGQFGFLGTEFTAEGPINREGGSSYLVNYRYSTLKLFESAKIKIGTSAIPAYQDAAFKLFFPTKKGNLSFFGIGGKSKIDIMVSHFTEPQEELYGLSDRDQHFKTHMGVVGGSYTHFINQNTFSKITVAGSIAGSRSLHELVYRNADYKVDSLVPVSGLDANEGKVSLNWFINKKISNRHTIKVGFFSDRYSFNMADSLYSTFNYTFTHRLDFVGETYLLQPYAQWKYKITDELVLNSGIHFQYLTLNGSNSIEPRAGLRWNFSPKHTLSFGAGVHSQMQPGYVYFHQVSDASGNKFLHNKHLGFTRSIHTVLGYDLSLAKNFRIRTETYYQYLFEIPVEPLPSAYTIINQGSSFVRFFPNTLTNKGTGKNYGVELTLEKFFSKTYFFLATGSLYESKYKGSDGIERNTDFNGNYAAKLLVGKEFKVGENQILSLGTSLAWAGGRRYTPIDINASALVNEAVYIQSLTNTKQLRDYFRNDLRITYKINAKKMSHEFAIDIVNLWDRRNVFALSYAPDPNDPSRDPLKEEYQLGRLPLFYYKIEF